MDRGLWTSIALCNIVLATGLASTSIATGGCLDQPDHLEPSDAILASFDSSFGYQVAIRRALLSGQPDTPYFRVIGLPSFFPEWSLTIGEPSADVATVTFLVAANPIYNGSKYRSPHIERSDATVDPATAQTLRAILKQLLLETRPCENRDGRVGMDGTTFSFSAFVLSRGVLSGEAWEPEPPTRAGLLRTCIRSLIRLTQVDAAEQQALRQQLSDQVSALKRKVVGEGG